MKRIEGILQREESIPELINSSSKKEMLDLNFQDYLLQVIQEEYLDKQDKVRRELENKQRYLTDFQQTQSIAQVELNDKYQQIHQILTNLNHKYQQVIEQQSHPFILLF